MNDFLDRLDELVDRPCQWRYCTKTIPESSPSDDFCSETCEHAWRAANNGLTLKRIPESNLLEASVPDGHPALPTHHGRTAEGRTASGGIVNVNPAAAPGTASGIFQVMAGRHEGPVRTSYLTPEALREQLNRIAELYAIPPNMLMPEALLRWTNEIGPPAARLLAGPPVLNDLAQFLNSRVMQDPTMPDSIIVQLPQSPGSRQYLALRMWRSRDDTTSVVVEQDREFDPPEPRPPGLGYGRFIGLPLVRGEIASMFRVPIEQVSIEAVVPQGPARRFLNHLRTRRD